MNNQNSMKEYELAKANIVTEYDKCISNLDKGHYITTDTNTNYVITR